MSVPKTFMGIPVVEVDQIVPETVEIAMSKPRLRLELFEDDIRQILEKHFAAIGKRLVTFEACTDPRQPLSIECLTEKIQ